MISIENLSRFNIESAKDRRSRFNDENSTCFVIIDSFEMNFFIFQWNKPEKSSSREQIFLSNSKIRTTTVNLVLIHFQKLKLLVFY